MPTDNTSLAPMSPIQRTTPAQRVANFERQSNSIYNKYSYYDSHGGDIGFKQPFVYTKITDSNFSKNLTRYDNYTFPVGSTVRDAQRMGKFMLSGTGLLFVGKQFLLQNANAFNETRVYNPLSVLKATLKPGSLGAIDYPQRHVETSGGILNFFKNAILDTIGIKSSALNQTKIDGTALGDTYAGIAAPAYSKYAGVKGGAKYGLMRFQTANAAKTQFSTIWADSPNQSSNSGGFLSNLASGLVSKLAAMIPSTNPFRGGTGSSQLEWKFRVEYSNNQAGIYHSFINTKSGLLAATAVPHTIFYNTRAASATGTSEVKEFHRYYPSETSTANVSKWYAPRIKIKADEVGIPVDSSGNPDSGGTNINNLKDLHKRLVSAIENYNTDTAPQFARSKESYKSTTGKGYTDIPGKGTVDPSTNSGKSSYYSNQLGAVLTMDAMEFSKASGSIDSHDKYNALPPISGGRNSLPKELIAPWTDEQSKDVIYFYFYDLVNSIYLPFRATIHGLNEQHSADWEDIKYIGRADRLFIYKGFTRDVNVNFKVYANSAKELVPMWERLSYLVGLTRPSKYTARAIVTDAETLAINEMAGDPDFIKSSGRESRFIYPPMITFRIGDMYVDQPAVLTGVNISIPDDVNWESFRGDSYQYLHGVNKTVTLNGVKSRQLPLQADVSITMRLFEKKQALVSNPHYGQADSNSGERWKL